MQTNLLTFPLAFAQATHSAQTKENNTAAKYIYPHSLESGTTNCRGSWEC